MGVWSWSLLALVAPESPHEGDGDSPWMGMGLWSWARMRLWGCKGPSGFDLARVVGLGCSRLDAACLVARGSNGFDGAVAHRDGLGMALGPAQ